MSKIIEEVKQRVDNAVQSGVWARSSSQGEEDYIVFASDYSFELTVQHLNRFSVPFKNMTGQYVMQDGTVVQEDSFIVNARHAMKIKYLVEHQESLLLLGDCNDSGARSSTLHYSDGMEVDIGFMHSVSKQEAMQCDNWSYCPYSDVYFVCKH